MSEQTKKSSPTPGPWATRFIYRTIKAARKDKSLLFVSKPGSDWADAAIMAAAPEMLAAIKMRIEEKYLWPNGSYDEWKNADDAATRMELAAVAKAEERDA